MKSLNAILLWISVGFAVIAGCGGGPKRPDGMPELYKTTITVTQADSPLADAMVVLKLANGSQSQWYSGGVTDANGVVTVSTQGDFPGAPAGNYKVLVSKTATEPNPKDSERNLTFDMVEPQYANVARTPLEIEVKSGLENAFTLDVGPASKKEVL